MKVYRHGISIGLEKAGSDTFFLTLSVSGKLTHEDYEELTPMLEAALATVHAPKVRVFIDAIELEGWEPRAAWDDLKLGLKHGNEFERIAIFGNRQWQELAAKLGSWFVSGEVKYFEDRDQAFDWLNE
jgi:hypothetical protein